MTKPTESAPEAVKVPNTQAEYEAALLFYQTDDGQNLQFPQYANWKLYKNLFSQYVAFLFDSHTSRGQNESTMPVHVPNTDYILGRLKWLQHEIPIRYRDGSLSEVQQQCLQLLYDALLVIIPHLPSNLQEIQERISIGLDLATQDRTADFRQMFGKRLRELALDP